MTDEPAVPKANNDPGEIIARYIYLRDIELKTTRESFERAEKAITSEMDELEAKFVAAFNKQIATKKNPITTIPSAGGTCYREVATSLRVQDAAAFRAWVLEDPENRIHYMEARVAKVETIRHLTEIGEYVKTEKDKPLESFNEEPVPGLLMQKTVRAKFKKPAKRG